MIAMLLGLLRGVPIVVWIVAAALAWGAYNRHDAKTQAQARAVAEKAAAVQAATAAEQAKAREREQAWNAATLETANAYQANLAAAQQRAASVRAGRDKLFDAIAAAPGSCPAGASASAPSGVDGTAALRVVVRECATALSQVAEAADATDAKLIGLQQYVRATRDACKP